jgi:hypothetical protein
VRVVGGGKKWRGIVSLLTPVVVGVTLAYGWSAADTRMAAFRPPDAGRLRPGALSGHGQSAGSVDGTGTATQPSVPVAGSHVVSLPSGSPPSRHEHVRLSADRDKSHKPRHKRQRPGNRHPRLPTVATQRRVSIPPPRPTKSAAPEPDTSSGGAAPASRTFPAQTGAPGTPDRSHSVRLPYRKSSSTRRRGASGGLH